MPLVVLDAVFTGSLKGIKRVLPRFVKESLREVGIWWHLNLLQRHFTPGNESRYGTMTRNTIYMDKIKKAGGVGQGRYVKGVLKGKALRWMRAFPSITATQHRCVVRMVTPTYFDKPFIGSFIDPQTGRLKKVTRQPDKPAEATAVNDADRQSMTNVFKAGVESRVNDYLQSKANP
jgi:hypothetical protein